MTTLLRCGLWVLGLAFASQVSAAGCEYDTQCKGDRICEAGICVNPPAAVAPTPVAASPAPVAAAPAEPAKPAEPPRDPPTYCCTSMGKLGPFANPRADGTALKLTERCTDTLRNGVRIIGSVCY